MRITDRPSPNFDERDGRSIELLILHYTGMPSGEIAIRRLCDPKPRAGDYAFPWERPDDHNKIRLRMQSAFIKIRLEHAITRMLAEGLWPDSAN